MGQIILNFDDGLYSDVKLSPEQVLWWELQRKEWLNTIRPLSSHFFDATDHGEVFQKAVEIPAESLATARVVWGRETVLDALPKEGILGEIGVLKGYFSQQILQRAEPALLHLFDLDFSPLQASPDFAFKSDCRLVFHQGDSSTELAKLPDATLNYLYVDGNHARAAVARDLAVAADKLRPGGWLQLNDYTPFCYMHQRPYGVMHAVNAFLAERHWSVTFLALHPLGYHDIVLVKPG